MNYISTRDKGEERSSAYAIVNGISKDGGLYVPSSFPTLTRAELEDLIERDYAERAAFVLSKYLTDFTYDELLGYTQKAYSRFYGEDPCPLVAVDDGEYVMELWHGPTCAFKDMALTVLPYLMKASREKTGETKKTLVLVATSGDTGKAALEGFRDVDGTEIAVFYPSEGVSPMQKLQMVTQEGDNVYVAGIDGNFDDAQTAVKRIFADESIRAKLDESGYRLSSANSINWGRLAPQIAYYVSAYCDLVSADEIEMGDKVNFVVPSGNFGNILAGYYAMRMGLPINKLICASNKNNVLTDFFATGEYNSDREFYKTMSPSMDILVSSNLERLLFELSGRDDAFVAEKMKELKEKGSYTLEKGKLIAANIAAECADEDETAETIANYYDLNDYLLDPHTAVAVCVYGKYIAATGDDETPTVIVSTASPYKFPQDVYNSAFVSNIEDAEEAVKKLEFTTGIEIPEPLERLYDRDVRFRDVVDKDEIADKVEELYCK